MKRILVLRGGPSSEYEISLKTGSSVLSSLRDKYHVTDCVIDKEGIWHVNGMPINPESYLSAHDLVFNAMHGEYGEDGTVQKFLENSGVKFTGPDSLCARLAMNKDLAKKIFIDHGIKTPFHKVVKRSENIDDIAINIFRSFPMPVVLKPIDRGSSVGVSVARDYRSLRDTLISLFVHYDRLLVEEYIKGQEATVGIIDNFRGVKHYSLLPIAISYPQSETGFFDYDAKYSGNSEYQCPGNFSDYQKEELQEIAKKVHKILGLRHYSRIDFIVHPRRGVYVLEANALPGLTKNSLMPYGLEHIGSNYQEFIDHIVNLG